jgi:hypothetical protein
MLNPEENNMRWIRDASIVLLLLFSAATAFGQGTAVAPKPAAEATAPTSPYNKKLDDIYGPLKDGADAEAKALEAIKKTLEGAKVKLRDAEKMVDQLLDQLKKQRGYMNPDGDISKLIQELEGEAKKLADESLRDNDPVNQKRFEESAKRLADARERMNKLYKDSLEGITELDQRKRHITRALKAGVLEEASTELGIQLGVIEQGKQDRDKIIDLLREAHPTTGY